MLGKLQEIGSLKQQGASLIRARMFASTRQAAAQRSRAARLQATAQKRQLLAQSLLPQNLTPLPQAMTIGQAPQKPHGKKLRGAPRRKTVQPKRIQPAAWEAQQAQSKAQRALALTERRCQATEAVSLSPARDGLTSGTCSKTREASQQPKPMQVIPCSQPSTYHVTDFLSV